MPTTTDLPKAEQEPRREPVTPIHLQRVLVPVDFTPQNRKALRYAERLAKNFGAEIVLVHVFNTPVVGYEPMMMDAAVTEREIAMEEAEAQLELMRERVQKEAGLNATTRLFEGAVAEQIRECAEQIGADLIVVPTHGRTGLAHALHLGSTAERIVRYAPCPILVVRDVEHDFID
ncbi:MAG: universal stress protein [Verrucomicrobia bacterium]|nr:universal stress protein [Verrucomicrobiota bacterium]